MIPSPSNQSQRPILEHLAHAAPTPLPKKVYNYISTTNPSNRIANISVMKNISFHIDILLHWPGNLHQHEVYRALKLHGKGELSIPVDWNRAVGSDAIKRDWGEPVPKAPIHMAHAHDLRLREVA